MGEMVSKTDALDVVYDGSLMVRDGDIIEVLRGFRTGEGSVRATRVRNISQGRWEKRSEVDGTLMSQSPVYFDPPYLGKVRDISFPGGNRTCFTLTLGNFIEDHIFVPAGQPQKCDEILARLLSTELSSYVKLCDPYIGERTFKLLQSVPNNIKIFILFEKLGGGLDIDGVKRLCVNLAGTGRNVKIRRCRDLLHSRFILTLGNGWTIGHSLKDAGEKDTSIDRLNTSGDVEAQFDHYWVNDSEPL